MHLIKASATGNDFILVDLLDGTPFDAPRPEWVRRVSDRHEGVGSDGVVFLEAAAANSRLRWDFYNADGGRAEMCGNATRATGLYYHHRTARSRVTIETVVGPVEVVIHSPARIESSLPPVSDVRRSPEYTFVRAGVPHAVVAMSDVGSRADLRKRAHEIKARPEFRADGVNVTFVHVRGPGEIDAVTFERGVEDFTLSCGTGAVAAAFASDVGSTVQVRVPGGTLSVVCTPERPVLVGPARLIARFDWLA